MNMFDKVGCTPTVTLPIDGLSFLNLKAKLESYNPTGSVKDRAASYLIDKLFKTREIDCQTTLIESSSGNFGVSLAACCKKYGLKFICVVDKNVSPVNEMLIRSFDGRIIKIKEPDGIGGYLLNRIKMVKRLSNEIENAYWINQYENQYNADAYYHSIGDEICNENEHLDFIFIGVSSGGTITGISNRVKEKFANIKVIAVDVCGSVIFGHSASQRSIPGIGSSIVPKIIHNARIDDVVIVDELSSIQMCFELLHNYSVFVGGSSGSVFTAVNRYFSNRVFSNKVEVLAIFPDSGWKYLNTIYNDKWRLNLRKSLINGNNPSPSVKFPVFSILCP